MSFDVSVVWCSISVRFHPSAALLISHLLKSVGIATTWPGSTGAFPALPSGLLRVYKWEAPAFPPIFHFIVKNPNFTFCLFGTVGYSHCSVLFPRLYTPFHLVPGGTPHAVKTTGLYCK